MKPVGQHWTTIDRPLHECLKVDEDVPLMRSVFALAQNPADMSPVIIERGCAPSPCPALPIRFRASTIRD